MNLARKASAIEPGTATSPWPGHEHVRGYAALELPFSTGHLLGLRVWPQTDFTPWTSVWHRTPGGEWSMYNDGPSLETTCPRYWRPILERAELASIDVTWTGANELRVTMDEPALEWTMSMRAPPLLRGLNALNASLPLWTWKPAPLLRLRESISKHLLGMGEISLSFTSASGHEATIMPQEVYYVDDPEAVLDGDDLGDPVRLAANPTIGDVPTPARPVFVFGRAHMRIMDGPEYHLARERVTARSGGRRGEDGGRSGETGRGLRLRSGRLRPRVGDGRLRGRVPRERRRPEDRRRRPGPPAMSSPSTSKRRQPTGTSATRS